VQLEYNSIHDSTLAKVQKELLKQYSNAAKGSCCGLKILILNTAGLQIRQNTGNMNDKNWRSIHCHVQADL
jgi:hypothetical protein